MVWSGGLRVLMILESFASGVQAPGRVFVLGRSKDSGPTNMEHLFPGIKKKWVCTAPTSVPSKKKSYRSINNNSK